MFAMFDCVYLKCALSHLRCAFIWVWGSLVYRAKCAFNVKKKTHTEFLKFILKRKQSLLFLCWSHALVHWPWWGWEGWGGVQQQQGCGHGMHTHASLFRTPFPTLPPTSFSSVHLKWHHKINSKQDKERNNNYHFFKSQEITLRISDLKRHWIFSLALKLLQLIPAGNFVASTVLIAQQRGIN